MYLLASVYFVLLIISFNVCAFFPRVNSVIKHYLEALVELLYTKNNYNFFPAETPSKHTHRLTVWNFSHYLST